MNIFVWGVDGGFLFIIFGFIIVVIIIFVRRGVYWKNYIFIWWFGVMWVGIGRFEIEFEKLELVLVDVCYYWY